jgi:hypothetical protein
MPLPAGDGDISAPHDVNGKNAALMTGEQVVDEIADDRVRFIS